MSLLFFKRVLANPRRVGYIVPSTPFLTRQTAGLIDFTTARTVVELGPGEGCHSRRILRRLRQDSRLILIELDAHFAAHLTEQFADDSRVCVVHANALGLSETLKANDVTEPDYIVSGIPFTIMARAVREELLAGIALAMGPASRFITYQATLSISDHQQFDLVRKKHCMLNIPPLHVMELRKSSSSEAP
jgi:phosphatidylethanolamine/phosphatidyl-N-methylethanolamine N-methyltransferase